MSLAVWKDSQLRYMKNIFKQAHISQETLLQSEVKHFSNGSDICYSAYFRSYYIDEEVEFKNLCTSCMHIFPLYVSQLL